MIPIEFFIDKNGRDLVINENGNYTVFTEKHTELIDFVYDTVGNDYPEAFKALEKLYCKSANFKYLMIRRFLKCNFSKLDENPDIKEDKSFHLEFVPCPLRGECLVENIVCQPKYNSNLSDREIEIVKLLSKGKTAEEISTELYRSIWTIKNHRNNILRKTNCENTAALITWCANQDIL